MLRVIIGPTGAGKSGLAMALAEARGLAIVSADSRQVYRGFDIGTAKPTADERAHVPHYGIDVVPPTERYSAHAWAADATRWIADAGDGGRDAVIVGGTGFYVRALTMPIASGPTLDPDRRTRLAAWLDAQDPATIARWSARLDAPRSRLGRTQQLRAIETALLAGVRLSDVHALAPAASPRRVRYLVVDPGPALAGQIERRVGTMLRAGWIDEVRRLRETVPPTAPAWAASGYAVLAAHVDGLVSREHAVARVLVETRQYAKRQRTWCRHQLRDGPVTWLDPNVDDALPRALAWWDGMHMETA